MFVKDVKSGLRLLNGHELLRSLKGSCQSLFTGSHGRWQRNPSTYPEHIFRPDMRWRRHVGGWVLASKESRDDQVNDLSRLWNSLS